MSIESVMPSNHLILCHTLLLLPSIFPSIRVFPNEWTLCIRWPKYWSFSISPSNDYWFPLGLTGFISLLSKGLSRVFSGTTIWNHQSLAIQPSLWSNSHIPGGICLQCRRPGFYPWVGKIPWRRKWQPTPVLLPRRSHGRRSLVSMGLQRVGHDWATSLFSHPFITTGKS